MDTLVFTLREGGYDLACVIRPTGGRIDAGLITKVTSPRNPILLTVVGPLKAVDKKGFDRRVGLESFKKKFDVLVFMMIF